MATADTNYMWLMNLHDVYMNANLMRVLMEKQPLANDAEAFMTSPRGRLERAWERDLYVAVEAWTKASQGHRAYAAQLAAPESGRLQDVVASGDADGYLTHLRNVRDYMSHRDKREYWDLGRTAVAEPGMLQWAYQLDKALEDLTLTALRATGE